MKNKSNHVGILSLAALAGCATNGQNIAERIYQKDPVRHETNLEDGVCAELGTRRIYRNEHRPTILLNVCYPDASAPGEYTMSTWKAERLDGQWQVTGFGLAIGCVCNPDGSINRRGMLRLPMSIDMHYADGTTGKLPLDMGKQEDTFFYALGQVERNMERKK